MMNNNNNNSVVVIAAAMIMMTMLAVISGANALPTALSYQPGQEFIFNLHGSVDARGNVQSAGQVTNGTTSTLDSVYVHRCNQINSDGSFIFVANMFNTQVGVGQSVPEARANKVSLSLKMKQQTISSRSSIVSVGDAAPLGDDMYFQQLPSGEITNVWYQNGDSPYFVNVKLSAISAFQTYVTQTTVSGILEQDPCGVHTSNYQGTAAAMLNINKQFTQQNFRSFSDAQVNANNVNINAASQTVVHPSGYIYSTSTNQVTNVVSMQLGAMARTYTNSTGFDMNMRSVGSLNIALQSQQVIEAFTKVSPINNANFTKGSLFEVAKNTIQALKVENYKLPTMTQDPIALIQSVMDSPQSFIKHHKDLKTLIRYFDSSAPRVIESLEQTKSALAKYIALVKKSNNKELRNKLFYLLTGARNFEEIFFNEFITSESELDDDLMFHAVLSANTGLKQPSNNGIRKIHSLFTKLIETNSRVRDASLLAFGSLVSREAVSVSVKKDAAKTLLEMFDRMSASEQLKAQDPHLIVTILGAIYNAESIFAQDDITKRFAKLLASETNPSIRSALRMVLSAFAKKYAIPASKLTLDDSPYPYNRSITKDYNLGGETISIDLHGDLFIGTNFDCNHPNFNYDGRIEAYANVDVLGVKQSSIFDAKAEYGKQGSQPGANQIFLSVFDKVVYQQALPGQLIDCNLHTYQLYHTSNGFNYEYTVWVSIVPITFSAGADLGLDADWSWQICDAQLSAMVEAIPAAQLTVSGKAEIDLLIIRGGVELDASFQVALVPQAYIKGTLCTVGVDVELQTQPMSANLEAFYAWKDCKYWIFDCKWGNHDEKTLWSWSLPSQQKTLYKQEWKITP